jgi:putative endonuclease
MAGFVYYTYILASESFPDQIYVGSTSDLRKRLTEQHSADKSTHTNKCKPWQLKIYIAFQEKGAAERFESRKLRVRRQRGRRQGSAEA